MFKGILRKGAVLIIGLMLLSSAVSYGEDNNVGPIREAIRLSKKGDYQGAISIFNELLKKDDYIRNQAIHFHLGMAYYSSGQYSKALNEFITTESLDQTKYMTYYFTGLIYEAEALAEKDPLKVKELKNKALAAWNNFLKFADADKKTKIKIAEKHISLLQEGLNEK